MDAAQRVGIKRRRSWSSQDDGLIAADAGGAVVRMRIAPPECQIVFGANDEEGQGHVQAIEALEVEVAAVQYNE